MLQSQRQDGIITYLESHDYLEITTAVEMFDSSPATINRDFNELARSGKAERVRGGLRPIRTPLEPSFASREHLFSEEKARLAHEAAKLLRPGQVIFVDGGTTMFHLGRALPDFPLHIVTNSLRLAVLLESETLNRPSLEVSLTGGYLYKQSGILLGPNTRKSIEHYHAEVAFLSVGGINRSGAFNTNELVTETERAMIERAEKTVILADHSKVGRAATCHVCPLDDVDVLITTNTDRNADTLDHFRSCGIGVICCAVND